MGQDLMGHNPQFLTYDPQFLVCLSSLMVFSLSGSCPVKTQVSCPATGTKFGSQACALDMTEHSGSSELPETHETGLGSRY